MVPFRDFLLSICVHLVYFCVRFVYLDGVFECHEDMQPLLLAHGVQADAVVQISQLSGSERVLSVHLDHSTVRRSPLTRSRGLKYTQHTLFVLQLMVFSLLTQVSNIDII